MKIGILTFPHSPSIGAMLQMRSLYHVLEDLGHDPEIINYVSDKVNHQIKKDRTPKSIILSILSSILIKSSSKSYKDFEAPLKMFPNEPSFSSDTLNAIAHRFDKIIVGSDQVWNPIVTGYDKNFYLEFCQDSYKKISYAASFGYSEIEEKEKSIVSKLLNQFAYLSVREKQGAQIIKELTNRDATVVLDPTLLVTSEYLRSLAKRSSQTKKYVLFFCIKPSNSLYKKALQYSRRYGFRLVTVGGRMIDRINPFKYPEFGVGPQEFLGLVDSAECVFTNSFHGTAISIALHRKFYVEFSSDTNSRLSNLTEILNLEDRIITNKELLDKSIDYQAVDEALSHYRYLSLDFLTKAVSE